MKIIVLQLARLGDIIQTLPTVEALKKSNPGCEITLVARSTFADAARLSPHVDKLVEFPSEEVLGPCLEEPGDRLESLARLARWLTREVILPLDPADRQYDLLINLTFSPASSYLATLIPAKARRGLHRALINGTDSYVITDLWSQYFFAQVLGYNLNILHLNDLFLRIAGLECANWPLELREPAYPVPVPPLAEGSTRIGIQVTASRNDKTPNEKVWAAICNSILTQHPKSELIFFGSASDNAAIESVLAEMSAQGASIPNGRCTILAGAMKFHENLNWIKACNWIVAPDTALVHLASACGTRIIEIPLGPVRPEETGPYGDGHHVVYPTQATPPQLAAEIARIIGGEKAKPCVNEAVTRLTKGAGGIHRNELVPSNYAPDEAKNFFEKAYYLLAEFRCSGRQDDIEIPELGAAGQEGALDRLVINYDALCTMRRLADYGQHFCIRILENLEDKSKLSELLAKIAEVENMLSTVQNSVPLAKPLVDTWKVSKDVAYAPTTDTYADTTMGRRNDVVEIVALAEGSYRELGQNIEIVQQLLQSAVTEAQKRLAKKAGKNEASKPKERV